MHQVLTLSQRPSTANFNQNTNNTNKPYYIPSTPMSPPESPCQLHVFWKYHDTLGMYCTQICVPHQSNKVGLGGLMEDQDGTHLDPVPHALML